VRLGAVTGDRAGEKVLRRDRVLSVGDQPAGNVAEEDIHDDVELYHTPFTGPFGAVIPHDHSLLGPWATSSGRTRGGWVAWRRRSRTCPAARAIRYIVEIEHQYRPSSSSRAQICGIARSR
jgi:hypothetical protein